MASVLLRYRLHFVIYAALIAFFVAASIFPMIASWNNYWQIAGKPKWFVIPLVLVVFANCCWKAFITSSELQLEKDGVVVRRLWGRQSLLPFSDIARTYRVTKTISLIHTTQGRWISLAGLTATGMAGKLEIERAIEKHTAQSA